MADIEPQEKPLTEWWTPPVDRTWVWVIGFMSLCTFVAVLLEAVARPWTFSRTTHFCLFTVQIFLIPLLLLRDEVRLRRAVKDTYPIPVGAQRIIRDLAYSLRAYAWLAVLMALTVGEVLERDIGR
jgi:hypothetical protein